VFQRFVEPFCVVEPEVVQNAVPGFRDGFVALEIDLFVLDTPPEAFHEDVVEDTTSTIHAHPDPTGFKTPCELCACELGALVCVDGALSATVSSVPGLCPKPQGKTPGQGRSRPPKRGHNG